jgi:hypothetical protein
MYATVVSQRLDLNGVKLVMVGLNSYLSYILTISLNISGFVKIYTIMLLYLPKKINGILM